MTAHTSTTTRSTTSGKASRRTRRDATADDTPHRTAPTSDLNVAVLRGRIAAMPQWFDTRDASPVASFDLVTVGDGGRETTPVSWFDPPAWVDELDAGDEVVVVGRVRKRFVRASATSRPFTDVVAHQAARTSRRKQVAQLLADAASKLARS